MGQPDNAQLGLLSLPQKAAIYLSSLALIAIAGAAFTLSAVVQSVNYERWKFQEFYGISGFPLGTLGAELFYVSSFAFIFAGFCYLKHWSEKFALLGTLIAQTIVVLPFLLCFSGLVSPSYGSPGEYDWVEVLNFGTPQMAVIYFSYVTTGAIFLWRVTRGTRRILLMGWALTIVGSILGLHAFSVFALFIVGALIAFGGLFCRPKLERHELLLALEVEAICLWNFWLFTRRHSRYFFVFLGVTGASLFRWRRRRALRTGFCFLQVVDDYLDGDRIAPREPLGLVDDLITQIESGSYECTSDSRLARAFVYDLQKAGGQQAVDQAIALIRVMQFDRRRVKEGLLLNVDTLKKQHRDTFIYSLNITLIAGRAQLRGEDAPLLVELFGWCNTIRDLHEDLNKGLVNIPKEVVDAAYQEGVQALEFESLVATNAVRNWLASEYRKASAMMRPCEENLENLKGRSGVRLLRYFAFEIKRYIQGRFEKAYGAEITELARAKDDASS